MNENYDKPRTITLEEQREMGLRVERNFVAPVRAEPTTAYQITPAELASMQQGNAIAGQVMAYDPAHLAKSQDTAQTIANASLTYALSYGCIFAAVALPVGLILVFGFGASGWDVSLISFLTWGAFTMYMLRGNRAQGLYHSPTGIGHHEIESREKIAIHAIDRHVDMVERRWEIER